LRLFQTFEAKLHEKSAALSDALVLRSSCLPVLLMALLVSAPAILAQQGVSVVPHEAARRVDILVDGRPFTSYVWPETQKKPVLYPLNTADGTPITRGFPLEPRAGAGVDHPHHAGLCLTTAM
jgi:hypothetical protein